MKTERVGKLTLGLVLIIIGLAFTAEWVLHMPILVEVVNYWPFVFILLGLEYLLASKVPDTKARLSIGALALITLVFLASAGYAYGHIFLGGIFGWMSEPYTVTVDINETVDMSAIKAVEVRALGKVDVNGTSSDKITGSLTVTVRARTYEEAKKIAESITGAPEIEGDVLVFRLVEPGRYPYTSISSWYSLAIPEELDLTVDTVSGRVAVQGIYGHVCLESVSGSIDVDGKPEYLVLETVSGRITAQLNLHATQAFLSTVSGDIRLEIPEGAGGYVSAKTTSGEIYPFDGLEISQKPGSWTASGSVGEGDTEINLKSVSGTIKLFR